MYSMKADPHKPLPNQVSVLMVIVSLLLTHAGALAYMLHA